VLYCNIHIHTAELLPKTMTTLMTVIITRIMYIMTTVTVMMMVLSGIMTVKMTEVSNKPVCVEPSLETSAHYACSLLLEAEWSVILQQAS